MADFVDLTDIVPLDSVEVEIKRGEKGTGWFVTIGDASHPDVQRRLNDEVRKATKARKDRKSDDDDRDPEEIRKENLAWIVSRVVGWSPIKLAFISADPIEYSEANAIKVFGHPKMAWALPQIMGVIADENSFMKPSA